MGDFMKVLKVLVRIKLAATPPLAVGCVSYVKV